MSQNIILILGHRLEHNSQISVDLVKRLNLGIEVYRTFKDEICILCSGGYPYNQTDNGVYESIEMKRYLIENNIPEQHILCEKESRETVGNLVFSLQMILNMSDDVKTLHIISSRYHIPRIKVLMNKIKESESWTISYHGSESEYGHTLEQQHREQKVIKMYEYIFSEIYALGQIETMMKQNIIGYSSTPIRTPEKIQEWLKNCEI